MTNNGTERYNIIPALHHLIIPIDDIRPDPSNAREAHDLEGIADSLQKYGQRKSIVYNEKTKIIEAGSGTHQAAKILLGWTHIAAGGVNDDPHTATGYAIADNLLTDKSRFNLETLELQLGAFDDPFEIPGVDEGWLSGFDFDFGGNGGGPEDTPPQIDKAAELQKKWGTALGQVWQLGEHRVACGDCTDAAVVEAVMQGERAEVLFTSPPYSDQREYSGNDLSINTLAKIFGGFRQFTGYFVINLGLKHKNDELDCYWDEWLKCARNQQLKLLSWNVWDKINATSVKSQMSMFALQHEWIFILGDEIKPLNRTWEKSPESKKREKYYRLNEKGQKVTTRRQADGSVSESIIGNIYENKQMGTVSTFYAEMGRTIDHPAKFPVDLPMAYIEAMTNEDDLIIDPFLGSGTTLIACENLGRQCRGIEIDPGYIAVTLQRWHDHTNQQPQLVSG